MTRGCPECDHGISLGAGRTSKCTPRQARRAVWGSSRRPWQLERVVRPLQRGSSGQPPRGRRSIALMCPRGRTRRWCSIRLPQLPTALLICCILSLSTDVMTAACPGSFPLLLMRQEEPKHVMTRVRCGTQEVRSKRHRLRPTMHGRGFGRHLRCRAQEFAQCFHTGRRRQDQTTRAGCLGSSQGIGRLLKPLPT